jgi:hypothetical protein
MSSHEKPILTIRDGALKASIWANRTDEGKTFHSVTFGRTFTDGEGQAKTSSSFSGSDLLKIARLADKAYDRIAALRLEASQQQEAA